MQKEDIFDSLKEWFKEKNNSSIYFSFLLVTITWNWKFFYALFFISEENLVGITNIDYAISVGHFLTEKITYVRFEFINDVTLVLINFLSFFLIPMIVTYFLLWHLPHLNVLAHKKGLFFYFQRKSEFDLQKSKYLGNKKEETEHQIKTLEAIEKSSKERDRIEQNIQNKKSPEERIWEEFEEFKFDDKNLMALRRANDLIYRNQGYYSTNPQDSERFILPQYLSALDIYGVISWPISGSQKIEFTDKGKLFLRKLDSF